MVVIKRLKGSESSAENENLFLKEAKLINSLRNVVGFMGFRTLPWQLNHACALKICTKLHIDLCETTKQDRLPLSGLT